MPKHYWGEAVLTAAYLINRLPSRNLGLKSPIQLLTQGFPNFVPTDLCPKVFGSLVFIHNHSPHRGKLDPRALKCVFVGYSPTQKGYKCFHPPSKKFFVSADVKFVEDQSYFQNSYTQGEIDFLGGNAKEFYLPTLPCSSSACPRCSSHSFSSS